MEAFTHLTGAVMSTAHMPRLRLYPRWESIHLWSLEPSTLHGQASSPGSLARQQHHPSYHHISRVLLLHWHPIQMLFEWLMASLLFCQSVQCFWMHHMSHDIRYFNTSQIVNAIHGAFKNWYFSRIYTRKNPSIYTFIILVIYSLWFEWIPKIFHFRMNSTFRL